MRSVILADELPHDVTGAEELIQRLLEHKTEIDARKTSINLFLKKGKKLVASNHYAKDEVKKCNYKVVLDVFSFSNLPSATPLPLLIDTRENELS